MLRFYKKKKGYARYIMFYTNLIVFALSAGYLFRYYYNGYKNRSKISQLNEITDSSSETVVDDKGNIIDRYGGKVRQTYPELVGRLNFHYYNKELKLPIMQHEDNDFWLYRDVETNDSDAGTPFADYRCNIKDSLIVVVYAHNMKDLSQFGALKSYNSEKYWKEYPTITYESMYEEPCEYEIVAAFYSQIYDKDSTEFKYYSYFSFDDEKTYNSYVENVKKLACYDTGITPKYGDKLLLLSTCDYTQGLKTGRFAVLARKTGTAADNSDFNIDEPKSSEKPKGETNQPSTNKPKSTPDNKGNNNDSHNNNNNNHNNNNSVKTKSPQTTKTPTISPTETPTKAPTKAPTNAPIPTQKATKTPEKSKEPTKEPVVTKEPTPTLDAGENPEGAE